MGFVGTDDAKARCLEEKVEGWQALVAIMDRVAGKQPQKIYAGLQNSLQQEWDFVQCVNPDIGKTFQPVEDELREIFLPDLFKGSTYQIPSILATGLPLK